MMGRTHAATGLAAGVAVMPCVGLPNTATRAAWVVSCAGFTLLPDLDQRKTTAARMWGPVTEITASVIGFVARGHRQGTHDAILAPLIFGGLAWWAVSNRWATLTLIALAVGLGIRAVSWAIKSARVGWLINLTLSVGAAWWLSEQNITAPWLPLAVIIGVLAHIAGDALTTELIPVPLVWMMTRKARWGIPLCDTNSWLEPLITALSVLTSAWLIYKSQER